MQKNVYSFEDGALEGFSSTPPGQFKISRKHPRDGQHSLRWDYHKGAKLILDSPNPFRPFSPGAANKAQDSFILYMYSEEKRKARLRFDFLKKGKRCCHFTVPVYFAGRRALWVPYEESMEGTPEAGMDRLEITAEAGSGSIWLDQMILAVAVDPRHPTRDAQQPFVNLRADTSANAHWMSLYRFSLLENEALKRSAAPISPEVRERVTARLDAYFCEEAAKREKRSFESLKEDFLRYEIKEKDGFLEGRTIDTAVHRAAWPEPLYNELLALTRPIDVKETAGLLLDLAYYLRGEAPRREEAENYFLLLTRHMMDQGFAAGSGLGTVHHLGYPLRNYYFAMFLQRGLLARHGLLKDVSAAMAWYSGRGRVFRPDREMHKESMDTYNTLSAGILASVLTEEDPEKQDLFLRGIKHWLNLTLVPAPGLAGPFKVDGSVFHHCGHYPAYALGGLKTLCPVIYCLSRTPYAIDEAAHATVKKALLAMRFYCNLLDWPVSMAARHPLGKGKNASIFTLNPFRYLAMAGSPDGKEPCDKELAAAYLRLAEGSREPAEYTQAFYARGFKAEDNPHGHLAMNYAAASMQRRDDWLCSVRGHSRYLWANESYLNCNLYGRYITYGHLEVLNRGEPISLKGSGYQTEGFDFNCFPGTTTEILPEKDLRAVVLNVDRYSGFEEMLLSDERFCGGLMNPAEGNGLFAVILHGHPKYNESFRARKSYFFFDELVLCLGTGIENGRKEHETVTTLFQKHLEDGEYLKACGETIEAAETLSFGEEKGGSFCEIKESPETPFILEDNKGCSYIVPAGQQLRISAGMQDSFSPIDRSPTKGRFAKALLSHGFIPEHAAYQYTLCINTDYQAAEAVAADPPYRILRADNRAHIVENKKTGCIYYALFEAVRDERPSSLFLGCSKPLLLLIQLSEDQKTATLRLCDPDLRLYEGIDPEQYDTQGRRKELSIYSRPWRNHPSRPAEATLLIRGLWDTTDCTAEHEEDATRLSIVLQDALNYEIRLER